MCGLLMKCKMLFSVLIDCFPYVKAFFFISKLSSMILFTLVSYLVSPSYKQNLCFYGNIKSKFK
jgi:hypothetical protein